MDNSKLVKVSKNSAVNPRQVMFLGLTDDLKTVVFIVGCPKGIHSDYSFDDTVKLLNGEDIGEVKDKS